MDSNRNWDLWKVAFQMDRSQRQEIVYNRIPRVAVGTRPKCRVRVSQRQDIPYPPSLFTMIYSICGSSTSRVCHSLHPWSIIYGVMVLIKPSPLLPTAREKRVITPSPRLQANFPYPSPKSSSCHLYRSWATRNSTIPSRFIPRRRQSIQQKKTWKCSHAGFRKLLTRMIRS